MLELPCGTFHDITHQETAHLHTAKGYTSASAEAGWQGKEGIAFFLNVCIAQLAKMSVEKKMQTNSLPYEAESEELLR